MTKLDQETAVSVLEIQHLITEWGLELDANGGADIARLCTEDCDYIVGGNSQRGHAAVTSFYAARNERVSRLQKDGVRTQRHQISNVLTSVKGKDSASATFLIVNFSAEGKPPALNLVGPTIVADCRMEFRREADGAWRIALFDSTPVFIGNDPFLNAAVVRK